MFQLQFHHQFQLSAQIFPPNLQTFSLIGTFYNVVVALWVSCSQCCCLRIDFSYINVPHLYTTQRPEASGHSPVAPTLLLFPSRMFKIKSYFIDFCIHFYM